MFNVIVSWYDGTTLRKTRISANNWYNIINDCFCNGISECQIIKIEKDIDVVEIDNRTKI
jgi:hypothetical protein